MTLRRVPVWPRQRGAVRLGGVGGRQDVDARRGDLRVTQPAEAVDRPGKRELGRTKPVDEVAPPDSTGFLERPQDGVDPCKATLDALGEHRLPGQDAVAVQQGERQRVEPPCRAGRCGARGQRGDRPDSLAGLRTRLDA